MSATDDQRVTWLELFYDLIYVTAFGELAKRLGDQLSWSAFGQFLVVFLAVWGAWVGNTLFAARYGNGSPGYQWGTLLQILALGAITLNIRGDITDVGAPFAVAYAMNRLVLAGMYAWVARGSEEARPVASPFAFAHAAAAALWLVSAALPEAWQVGMWAVLLGVELVLPTIGGKRLAVRVLPHEQHLPERIGLLQIIVLGAVVTEIVLGATKQEMGVAEQFPAVLALISTVALWRMYFDNAGSAPVLAAHHQGRLGTLYAWLYAHLPLMLSLTTLAVGFGHGIAEDAKHAHTAERMLVCLSLTVALWSMALLRWTAASFFNPRHVDRSMTYWVLAGVVLLFVWRVTDTSTAGLAVIAAIVTVVGALIGLYDPAARALQEKKDRLEEEMH